MKPRSAGMLPVLGLSSVILVLAVAGCGQGGSDVSTSVAADTSFYDRILLPESAPPEPVAIRLVKLADPGTGGQQVMFQYQGFTVGVCSSLNPRMSPDACLLQGSLKPFREVTDDSSGAITQYVLYGGKADSGSSGYEPEQVRAFFEKVELTVTPAWFGPAISE